MPPTQNIVVEAMCVTLAGTHSVVAPCIVVMSVSLGQGFKSGYPCQARMNLNYNFSLNSARAAARAMLNAVSRHLHPASDQHAELQHLTAVQTCLLPAAVLW